MADFKDLKKTRNILPSIPPADRRAAWDEPEFEYDGREPPKAWLARMRQLQQIHGYNDKETLKVAKKCLKGDAQVWFRIHQPQSFNSLRTGLHTRFASGPIDLVVKPSSRENSAGGPAVKTSSTENLADEFLSASPNSYSSRFGTTKRSASVVSMNTIKFGTGERSFSASSTTPSTSLSGEVCIKTKGEKSVSASSTTPSNCLSGEECKEANRDRSVLVKSMSPVKALGVAASDEKVSSRRREEGRETCGDEPPNNTIRSMDTFSLSSMRWTDCCCPMCSNSLSAKDVLSSNGLKSLNNLLPMNGHQTIVQFKQTIHSAMN
ncbi:hypothetical protein Mapa_001725 [Marchantia paleacea]|nr:hypothetical protein Mapa_001725 [Marchantia paleacea]